MIRELVVGCLIFNFGDNNCLARRDPFTASTSKKIAPAVKIKLISVVLPQTEACCSVVVLQVNDQRQPFLIGQAVRVGNVVTNWQVSQITAEKVVLTRIDDPLVFKELLVADLFI
ncbi:MAG TPA: hypothetical protein VJJ81_04000 [Candidatus Babeliales bacterium]|nr:hypothetical protein [Candidatus Babeliales bacterium]